MRKFLMIVIGLALAVSAIDFDFTVEPPVANGKVPMIKLDENMKIGGTKERTALHFDADTKPVMIPDSGSFTLDNGLTIALEFFPEDKKDGKNWHSLVFKKNEYLLDRLGNTIYFKWKAGKKWLTVFQHRVSMDKPMVVVVVISKERKLSLWCDGKHYINAKLLKEGAEQPNSGNENIIIGSSWSGGNFVGDLYRIKVIGEAVPWNKVAEVLK